MVPSIRASNQWEIFKYSRCRGRVNLFAWLKLILLFRRLYPIFTLILMGGSFTTGLNVNFLIGIFHQQFTKFTYAGVRVFEPCAVDFL